MRRLSSLLLMHEEAMALLMLSLLLGCFVSFSTTRVLLLWPLLRGSIATACMLLLLLLRGGALRVLNTRLW
jgi:hypothetical protein